MNLNSLNIVKNILSQHSQKPYSLYKFSSKYVLGYCQENILDCPMLRHPGTAFLKNSESKCMYIPVYLCKKTFVLETQEVFICGVPNNFLKTAYCLDLVKYFKMFQFQLKFLEIQKLAFRYFHL